MTVSKVARPKKLPFYLNSQSTLSTYFYIGIVCVKSSWQYNIIVPCALSRISISVAMSH